MQALISIISEKIKKPFDTVENRLGTVGLNDLRRFSSPKNRYFAVPNRKGNHARNLLGALFSADVNQQQLAKIKAWAKYKPLADRFEQIVFDCVKWCVQNRPNAPIQMGAIINSLNHAIEPDKTTARQTDPAEVKAPAGTTKSNHYGFKGGVFIE